MVYLDKIDDVSEEIDICETSWSKECEFDTIVIF